MGSVRGEGGASTSVLMATRLQGVCSTAFLRMAGSPLPRQGGVGPGPHPALVLFACDSYRPRSKFAPLPRSFFPCYNAAFQRKRRTDVSIRSAEGSRDFPYRWRERPRPVHGYRVL